MVLGVIIGITLLVLLTALVVLQGMIEWGGVDTDKWFGGEKAKDTAPDKEDAKPAAGPIVKKGVKKPAKAASKKPAKKKGAK